MRNVAKITFVIALVFGIIVISICSIFQPKFPAYPGSEIASSSSVFLVDFDDVGHTEIKVTSSDENIESFTFFFEYIPYSPTENIPEGNYDFKIIFDEGEYELLLYKHEIVVNGITYELEEKNQYLNYYLKKIIRLYYYDIWEDYKIRK